MLRTLKAENLALLEFAELELGPGFVCLTGETGAGKSLLMDALRLLSGGRGSADYVRTGCRKASVEACFELHENHPELDLIDGNELFLRREITADGRSRAYVNGVAVPISLLESYSSIVFELFGQGGQQKLLTESRHLEFFDHSMGLEKKGLQLSHLVRDFQLKWASYWTLVDGERERLREMDAISMQIREIDEVDPNEEDLDLDVRFERVRHGEEIRQRAQSASTLIDDQLSSDLARLSKDIQFLMKFVPAWEPYGQQLQEASSTIDDLARDLSSLANDDEDEDLAILEARNNALNRLYMKYGRDLPEVIEEHKNLSKRLSLLKGQSGELPLLWSQLEKDYESLKNQKGALDKERVAAQLQFSQRVASELAELSFPNAAFSMDYDWPAWPSKLEPRPELSLPGAKLKFLFSPNPGEQPRGLAKIASGGELSRVLLAVICAAERSDKVTMVFDEVDAGIGGETATQVGKKLARLGDSYQTICVTHLAQVASKARQHLVIEKQVANERTSTKIFECRDENRVRELARLMGGDAESAALQEHASSMLHR